MSEVTKPRAARRKMLPAAVAASALFALLAFAPFASAAPDPVASGTTTLILNGGVAKGLNKAGVKIQAVKPAKVKGTKATFKVTGGSFDPTTGSGSLTHSGGLKFKAGKKTLAITGLEVNTLKRGLFGKVGGKKIKVASVSGVSFSRDGFGAAATIKKVKLTGNAANALNKKLGFNKGAKPFKGNRNVAKATTEEQPSTTTLVPGGNVTFALNPEIAQKLGNVKAEIVPLTGTTPIGPGVFSFPVTGGSFSSTGTAGTVESAGGLLLKQKLAKSATESINTEITLAGFQYDLKAKTITVEVSAVSNADPQLNLGALGRSSVADVTIGGVIADPNTRAIAVQNSSAILQPLSGEVLNGFVKVYAGYVAAVKKAEGKEAEGNALAAKIAAENAIAGGAPLGLISFSGQAQ